MKTKTSINLPHEECFGCEGCYNICPQSAINMIPDRFGFKHPLINPEKCIECHLCEKICTVINPIKLRIPKHVYAVTTKNENEHKTVSSGGLCTLLSREIIRRGGIVYGCSEKNYHTIKHIRVDREENLNLLKKSKYVQSEINQTFKSIKEDLMKGLHVLFIGTPCQVSGLYGFLRKPHEKLYTIDLVCHGVPSQQMLQDQIILFFGKKTDTLNNGVVDFRWKSRQGIRYGIKFSLDNKILKESREWENPYMAAFAKGLSYRDNCYSCPFAKTERIGDITAADFWGIGKVLKSRFIDKNGVSMALINSEKGTEIFNYIENQLYIESRTIEEAQSHNSNLSHPAPYIEEHRLFCKLYAEKGLDIAAKTCIPRYRKNKNLIYKLLYNAPGMAKLYSNILKFKNGKR